ncbi:hypothetical protein ACS0TY_026225 [Phlomoides rotata]
MNMEEDGESMHVNQNKTTEPISFSVDETSSARKSKRAGSKRNYGEGIEVQFLNTMGNYCDALNTNFGQIAETMGHIAKRVGSYLCNNSKDIDLFFSLPDEAKNVMVTRIMRKLAGGG